MLRSHKPGDLVHIPQAVDLIYHLSDADTDTGQLTIPLSMRTTQAPTVAIIREINYQYIEVYCEGKTWSVKPEDI